MRSTNTTLASALLIASLCLPFSGCRRNQDDAPPPEPSASADSATDSANSMPPSGTTPGPDSSVGVGTPPSNDGAGGGYGAGTGSDTTANTGSGDGMSGDQRTAGGVVDDTVITTKVKAALVAEPNLKAGDINVDTQNGAVTLAGVLDNQSQIDRALQIARGVEGVQNVNNKLSLRQ